MDNDAIPPSSPPRAPTVHTPDSPFFFERAVSLKSSSPPPLFSSDDSRESVDVTNYESPRIFKNKRKGAWWDNGESAHNPPQPKKSKFKRNFDSGVYMLSDSTNSSEEILLQHKSPFPMEPAHEELPQMSAAEAAFCAQLRTGLEQNLEVYDWRGLDLEDSDIRQIGNLASVIRNSPDPGNDLPAEGQYRSMVPELYVNLSQSRLGRLTPSLFDVQFLTTLVLRNNEIEELPQQIGQLQNLKALDVSLNRLQCLPFEILHLFQPFGSLEYLTTIGNPMLEPMSSARFTANHARSEVPSLIYTDSFHPDLDLMQYESTEKLPDLYDSLGSYPDREQIIWRIRYLESWANAFGGDSRDEAEDNLEDDKVYKHHPTLGLSQVSLVAPRYMARTLVSFFNQNGSATQGSTPLPASDDEQYPLVVETNNGAYGVPSSPLFSPPSTSRVPSLITTTLHNVFKKRHNDDLSIEDLHTMLPDPIPYDVDAIFTRALDNDIGGYGEFRQCHACSKEYVVARAEWIEFWSTGYGIFYPLKVRVCSWGCVPEEMMKRPKKDLAWQETEA